MFTKYENGAEVEISEVNRFASGAEQEADGVYAVKNGAEEQVWTAILKMKELVNTFTKASGSYATGGGYDGDQWCVFSLEPDGGYATWYLEGEFNNPTISFNWDGVYWGTRSDGVQQYASAGSISIYARRTSGEEVYPSAVGSLGNTYGNDEGEFSTRLTGSYDRIGFTVKFHNWGLNEPVMYWVDIYNILIDGNLSLPGEDCFFNL